MTNESRKTTTILACQVTLAIVAIVAFGGQAVSQARGQTMIGTPTGIRRTTQGGSNNNKMTVKPMMLKDVFYEDNSFVVRIRTTYNHSSSITCNAVVMEEQLVLSDVTCIKYQGMANIDAKYVHVIAGDPSNETEYEVEQIYINKADPKDPGTELALLRLTKPLKVDAQCRQLIRPERNYSVESETPVRVVGYSNTFELKEARTRIVKKAQNNKYVCTASADLNETPASTLLKGAPLLHMVDCRQFQLVAILTKLDTIIENLPGPKRHQDCYVMVSSQMRWYEQVKALTSLAAKIDGVSTQPSVIVVSVEDSEVTSP